MDIKKIKLKSGKTKYEVRFYTRGRAGKKLRRRFDKKIDAKNFISNYFKRSNFENEISTIKDISEVRLFEIIDYWYELKVEKSETGYYRSVDPAIKHMKKFWGNTLVSKINPHSFLKFRCYLKEDKKLKESSVNRYSDILIRMLNLSFEHEIINENPAKKIKRGKDPKTEMSFWNEEEVHRFLTLTNIRYKKRRRSVHVAYMIALETGLRAREIWGLKFKDIKFDANQILVSKQMINKGVAKLIDTKGKEIRVVPASNLLLEEIMSLKTEHPTYEDSFVIRNTKGNFIDHDSFVRRIYNLDIERAKVPRIRFHDMRHTAFTMMIKKGIAPTLVQRIAGHKDIKTTLRYIHVVSQDITDIAESLSLDFDESYKKNQKIINLKLEKKSM